MGADTHYINNTGVPMLDTIVFYNKALKNNLKRTLWRIEAKITIPNYKLLSLPLHELKWITDLAKTGRDGIIYRGYLND